MSTFDTSGKNTFLARHAILLTTFVLVFASFQLMGASVANPSLPRYGSRVIQATLSPIKELHSFTFGWVRDSWMHYVWLVGVVEERDELLSRLSSLEAQNSRLLEFEHENDRLSTLLKYRRNMGLEGVGAKVVGRGESNWLKTIVVDQGAESGIAASMPVVDGEAIVGQTTVVSGGSSKVLLLTDNSSSIDAIVQRSRARGIVEGTGGANLNFRFVVKEDSIQPGDRIIASGMDEVYPKGALVGVVTSVDTPTSGLFHQVTIEPHVKINRLEQVLVVTSTTDAKEAKK